MTTWGPLRWNSKTFAAIAVMGLVFGFQLEKLYEYNNLLFNLLFPFTNYISKPKSIIRYGKIHILL